MPQLAGAGNLKSQHNAAQISPLSDTPATFPDSDVTWKEGSVKILGCPFIQADFENDLFLPRFSIVNIEELTS